MSNDSFDKNLSVIIPMFNSQDTIISTLNSIYNQTSFKYINEVIVVNDGSTDNSLDIVKKYKVNRKLNNIVIIDKPNGGVSTARNEGMKVAKSEWIALLDSDDEWLPQKLEIQVEIIIKHQEIDFLGGDIDSRGLKILSRKIERLYQASVKDICIKNFPQPSTAIFKKKIYNEIGGFDENQSHAEDGNYFLKICARYNYFHLPVQMITYGGNKPGFGFSGLSANLKKMYEGNIKNLKELKKNFIITRKFYILMRIFYWAKYVRRLVITKVRKLRL